MKPSKSDIYRLTVDHLTAGIDGISFRKYQKKIYVFELDGEGIPLQSLLVRVYLNQRMLTVTLKSVYDKAMSNFKAQFPPDGIFNKYSWLFNSKPSSPYFPHSLRYQFEDEIDSFTAALEGIVRDYHQTGKNFYVTTPKMKKVIDSGLEYLAKQNVDPTDLAAALDQETKEGRVFQWIQNEVFLGLMEAVKANWNFETRLPGDGGDNARKLYYFSFNLLYYYINERLDRAVQNIMYRT
ncbi:MAG: hypothetical protein AAFV95_27805 [Bacteroidota bacterium]